MNFTEYTYAPGWVLDRRKITRRHIRFYIRNCLKLADYMEALPVSEHSQHEYAHSCGTPACALGHAAWSNEFPGLQFGVDTQGPALGPDEYETWQIQPVVNAGETAWFKAGRYFFGRHAELQVFDLAKIDKNDVVRRLRMVAVYYRAMLAEGQEPRRIDAGGCV